VQIASITADNASNILSAFKIHDFNKTEIDATLSSNADDDSDIYIIDNVPEFDEEEENEIIEDGEDSESHSSTIMEALSSMSNHTFRRNGCLAHLLQLGIKDAVAASLTVKTVTKKLTEVVSFFHRSPKWSSKLKAITNGMVLIRPCTTRWNSLYLCLSRMLLSNKVEIKTRNIIHMQCINKNY